MKNRFFVGLIVFLTLFIIACGSSSDTTIYYISGTVSGATLERVTINLTGAATLSTTTDANGYFSFTGGENGAFTLTPVKAGYTFNPASLEIVISGASVTNINFVAIAN